MRTGKGRILISLLTVLAMLLTFTVTAAARGYSDVGEGDAFAQAVELLSEIEVFTGYPDGTFQPDGALTRQEFAAVVVRALNKAGVAAGLGGVGAGFTDDADIGPWAMGYIVYSKDVGILDGYPDGSFKPQGNVTYAEAYKMLIVALGLEGNTDWGQNWPVPAMRIAGEIGLDKGITGAGANIPMSRGDLAIATWNAVNSTYGLDKDGNLEAGAKDKSLLEIHWPRIAERLKEDPRLAGTFETYLSSSKRIRVDGVHYNLADNYAVAINGWEDNGAPAGDNLRTFNINDVDKGDRVTLTVNAGGDVTYIAVTKTDLASRLITNGAISVVPGETRYGDFTIEIGGADVKYHVDNRTSVTVDGQTASFADAKAAMAALAKEYGSSAFGIIDVQSRGADKAHASAGAEAHAVTFYTTNTVAGKVTSAGFDTIGAYLRIDGGDKIYYAGFAAPAKHSSVVLLLDGRGVALSNLTRPAPTPAAAFYARVLEYEGSGKDFAATLEKADGERFTLSADGSSPRADEGLIKSRVDGIVEIKDGEARGIPVPHMGAVDNITSTYIRINGRNYPFADAGVFVYDGPAGEYVTVDHIKNGYDVQVFTLAGSGGEAGYIYISSKP